MQHDFVLSEARGMAPLVRAILKDVTEAFADRVHARKKEDLLATCRRSQNYRIRRLYYDALRDRMSADERYQHLIQELEDLGVALIDPVRGMAAFPFLWAPAPNARDVRRALFLLKLWESPDAQLGWWRFVDDEKERRIPAHWLEERPEEVAAQEA